jgi:hypothetical protein
MLPWGHAAVGYLAYVALGRLRAGGARTPAAAPVVALGVGTQLPDLIDKPLGWYLELLPSGRSLGHSLLVAAVLVGGTYWLACRYDRREVAIAFGLGHLLHIAGDAVLPVLSAEWATLSFLLWPVLPQPGGDLDMTILETLVALTLSPMGAVETGLFAATTVLWLRHGAPGLRWSVEQTAAVGQRLAGRS